MYMCAVRFEFGGKKAQFFFVYNDETNGSRSW